MVKIGLCLITLHDWPWALQASRIELVQLRRPMLKLLAATISVLMVGLLMGFWVACSHRPSDDTAAGQLISISWLPGRNTSTTL